MNDDFLHALRRPPAPEFAKALHARLAAAATPERRRSTSLRTTRWLALAASVAAVAFAFTLPSVRAGAEAFLDLFRVTSFTGVAFDASNLRKLEGTSVDLSQLIGEQVEVLEEAAPPVSYASVDEAGAAAGLPLLWPAYVPAGWQRTDVTVGGGHAVRVTADTAKLESLLADFGLGDVSVPAGLDGAAITVRVPPMAVASYDNGDKTAHLVQARSPEVLFPSGLDLGALAEIGLRLLGLDADEAYRLAYSVDWRSTLLVPVPTNAARFRQVDVAGHGGLSIEAVRDEGHIENVLLWSLDDRVLVLSGPLSSAELLEMAQSLQ
jgi:hypothetical protein